MDPKKLLERQDRLQDEARSILTKLRLPGRLSLIGRPLQVGSSALGLMVRRDLDITVICAELDLKRVAKLCSELICLDGIKNLHFQNRIDRSEQTTPTITNDLQISLSYQLDNERTWNIRVRLIDEPERQLDLQHIKSLPTKLNPLNRELILAIKNEWHQRPEYGESVTGYLICDAVLNQGVTSLKEFEQWMEKRPKTC